MQSPNEIKVPLKDLVDHLPTHVYWLNKHMVFLGCNKAQAKTVGLSSPQEIAGKTLYDFLSKKNADAVIKNNKLVLKLKQTLIFEEIHALPDGSKKTYISEKSPLFDEHGNVIGLLGISFNITEKKKMEENREILLETIIANLPGNVYWKNRDGKYLGCNVNQAENLKLPSPKAIIGKTLTSLHPKEPELANALNEEDNHIMKTGQAKTYEEKGLDQHRAPAIYLTSKVPLKNHENEVVGLLGLSFDVTKQKLAEIAKNDFISHMAHDVRTPLTGIIGMTKTLMQYTHDKKIVDCAQQISQSSRQLLTLLNNILEDVEAGIKDPTTMQKPFNPKQVLQNVEEFFSASLTNKGLILEIIEEKSLTEVLEGNAIALNRILLNLVGNAIKFTHQGKITLSAQEVKSPSHDKKKIYLEFKVIDSGIGIPKDKREIIFEPFARLHDASEGKYEGSGLGLHSTKKTIEALGGTISVNSTLGKGSTFTVTLPFAKSHLTLQTLQEMGPRLIPFSPELPLIPAKILLIEDNNIVAKVLVMQFEHLGCKVTLARSGKEALDKFKKEKFDLIYTDIGLPDLKGHEITKIMRAFEKKQKKKRTPIIALSAHVGEEAKKICMKAGMNSVLNKPVPDEILYQQISHFMGLPPRDLSMLSSIITKSDIHNHFPESHAIIDLDLGAKLICGDLAQAKEMLHLFRKGILEVFPMIQTYYRAKKWPELYERVHRIQGSCSFCGVPLLKKATITLELCVSHFISQGKNFAKIKPAYKLFEKEIKQFLSAYDRLNSNLKENKAVSDNNVNARERAN